MTVGGAGGGVTGGGYSTARLVLGWAAPVLYGMDLGVFNAIIAVTATAIAATATAAAAAAHAVPASS